MISAGNCFEGRAQPWYIEVSVLVDRRKKYEEVWRRRQAAQRSLYTQPARHFSVLMATSFCYFGSHMHYLVMDFGNLRPVAHLMHSALMVMFRTLAINSDHIGFG